MFLSLWSSNFHSFLSCSVAPLLFRRDWIFVRLFIFANVTNRKSNCRKNYVCVLASLNWLWFLVTQWMHDVHNVVSSTARPSSCRLTAIASYMEPIHLICSLPLCWLPSIFPSLIIFSSDCCFLMMCPKSHSLQIFHFHIIDDSEEDQGRKRENSYWVSQPIVFASGYNDTT